jgi:hypothetical protein
MTEQRWQAKIEADQAKILALLEGLAEKVEDRHEKDDVRYERLARVIYGENGKKDAPGLLVRLDRLEQAQERSKWFARTVGGAAVALALAGLWALLAG